MVVDLKRFETFFKEYQRVFLCFATSYVQNEEDAYDIVMESMMAFWNHRKDLPNDTNVPAYILTSIKNKCLNYLRAARNIETGSIDSLEQWKLDVRIFSLEDFQPYDIFTDEIREIVVRTLDSLPVKTRRIFELSRYRDYSNKDIANLTDLSIKSVEYHIGKALKALRFELKDYIPSAVITML